MDTLLPEYVAPSRKNDAQLLVYDLFDALDTDRFDDALRLLQTFLGTIPYTNDTDTEGHYQQLHRTPGHEPAATMDKRKCAHRDTLATREHRQMESTV